MQWFRTQPGNHLGKVILFVIFCLAPGGCRKESRPSTLDATTAIRNWGGAILFTGNEGFNFLLVVLKHPHDKPGSRRNDPFAPFESRGTWQTRDNESGASASFSALDMFGKEATGTFLLERNIRKITSCTLDEVPVDVSDCNTLVLVPKGNKFIAKKLTSNLLINPNLLGSFLEKDAKLNELIGAQIAKEKAVLANCLLVITDKELHQACFSPDGKHLATVGRYATVKIRNADTGQETHTLKEHPAPEGRIKGFSCVSFSPDGKQLATGGSGPTVRIWNTTTGQQTHTLEGHTHNVYCVSFSPDGKQLATGGQDQTVKIWNTTTGQETHTLKEHPEAVYCVSFSPDGKKLLAGGYGFVAHWDMVTGKRLIDTLQLGKSSKSFMRISFSPDGAQLAAAMGRYESKVLAVRSGAVIHTLQGTGSIYHVCFTPDGRNLATGDAEGTVVLWDANSGKEVRRLKAHTNAVTGVCFSPDGKRLATTSTDGTLNVWDIEALENFSLLD